MCFDNTEYPQSCCSQIQQILHNSKEYTESEVTLTECFDLDPAIKGPTSYDGEDEPGEAEDGLADLVEEYLPGVAGAKADAVVTEGEEEHGGEGEDAHVYSVKLLGLLKME